jgi:hypothetical protein
VNNLDQYKKDLEMKLSAFRRVFFSTDGKDVLAYLREIYMDIELFDQDPIVMAKKVAKHDLVKEMIALAEEQHEI